MTWQGVGAGWVPSAYSRLLFLPAWVQAAHHSPSKTDIAAKSRINSALCAQAASAEMSLCAQD